MDREKYKALFEYMENRYSEEQDRTSRLEDKAVKYLASITIAITAFVFLIRYVIDEIIPPSNIASWLVLISMGLTFLGLVSAWSMVFRSIKLQDVAKMPHTESIVKTFNSNKLESVYLALSKRYSEAASIREKEYSKKLVHVRKAYSEIVFTGYCFMIFVIMLVAHGWIKST